jgi:hypothetical protein
MLPSCSKDLGTSFALAYYSFENWLLLFHTQGYWLVIDPFQKSVWKVALGYFQIFDNLTPQMYWNLGGKIKLTSLNQNIHPF